MPASTLPFAALSTFGFASPYSVRIPPSDLPEQLRRSNPELPELPPFLDVFSFTRYTQLDSKICARKHTADRAVSQRSSRRIMLINRDYVGHMATEVIKKLGEGELVEVKNAAALTQRVRQAMMDEITVEDRISEEARQILTQHQDQMRSTGVSYQEMFKKVKSQLARDRKLVLR
jgi:hypothetical protein